MLKKIKLKTVKGSLNVYSEHIKVQKKEGPQSSKKEMEKSKCHKPKTENWWN